MVERGRCILEVGVGYVCGCGKVEEEGDSEVGCLGDSGGIASMVDLFCPCTINPYCPSPSCSSSN